MFLATYGADVQVFVGIFVLVFFLGLHLHYNPYEIDDLNRLETAALASEFVTLYCGLLYFWEKFEDDETGSQVLTIILIVMQGKGFFQSRFSCACTGITLIDLMQACFCSLFFV